MESVTRPGNSSVDNVAADDLESMTRPGNSSADNVAADDLESMTRPGNSSADNVAADDLESMTRPSNSSADNVPAEDIESVTRPGNSNADSVAADDSQWSGLVTPMLTMWLQMPWSKSPGLGYSRKGRHLLQRAFKSPAVSITGVVRLRCSEPTITVHQLQVW